MGIKEYFIEIGEQRGEQRGEKRGEQRGLQKGRKETHEEDQRIFTTNLLADGQYPSCKIAALVGVSENYVRKIKRTMKSNSVIS